MEKAAPPAARGTQDVTVVWIVFVLAVIGLIAAYWFLLYKPKGEEIQAVQASIRTKTKTLEEWKTDAKELLNYEDQFAALVHQWNENQHYFVNGYVRDDRTGTYQPQYEGREQTAIFETFQTVWSAARAASVYLQEMYVSEELEFYMDDDPFEVPWELQRAINWKAIMSNRGENMNPLFSSHNMAIKFFGNLQETRRFIEIMQKLEGDVKKLFSVHCFETADAASYRANLIGFSDVVLTDITLEIDMMLSVYEVNPKAKTANTPPDIPGTASCSYGSSGGGGRGGGGGGGGRGGGGVGLGI